MLRVIIKSGAVLIGVGVTRTRTHTVPAALFAIDRDMLGPDPVGMTTGSAVVLGHEYNFAVPPYPI